MSRRRHYHSRWRRWFSGEPLRRLFERKPKPGAPVTPVPLPRESFFSRRRFRWWRRRWERFKGLLKRAPRTDPAITLQPSGPEAPTLRKRFRLWRRGVLAGVRLKRLLPGLPALVALLCWPLIGFLAWRSSANVERQYVGYADRALVARKYEEARIACERLLKLDSEQHPFHVYRMAQCLAGLGQKEASLQLLTALAPVDSPQFALAHQAIANVILRDPDSDVTALRLAVSHLKQTLASGDTSPVVIEMLGQLHARLGDWERATEYFTRAHRSNPAMALPLAAVAQARGRRDEMNRLAAEAALYFESQARQRTGDTASRLGWAQALFMLQDYAGTLAVVEEGLKESDLPAYHRIAAQAVAGRLQELKDKSPAALPARLALVQQGLAHDPTNQALLRELVAASQARDPQAAEARAVLNGMLARGDAAAAAHFCLGMDAWQNKNFAQSRQHFEIALKAYPQMATIANNLAWLLTFSPPYDHERALQIMDTLIKRHPESPAFRETRGQVLVNLGRWQEAVTDLEYALPWYKTDPALHAALAKAYTRLGMKELALEHQRLAKSSNARKETP